MKEFLRLLPYFREQLTNRKLHVTRQLLWEDMLIEQLKLVHLEGRETNFFRMLSAHDLLIIDDFGMLGLEGQIQHDFEQIVDDRYNRLLYWQASYQSRTGTMSLKVSSLRRPVSTESCINQKDLS